MARSPQHADQRQHPLQHHTAGLLGPVVEPIAERILHERAKPAFQRDPNFIGRQLAAITAFVNLFSPEVRGQHNIPANGSALLIGNHSCVFWIPDTWLVGLEIVRRRGLEEPSYSLVYDLLFTVPAVGRFLRRIGSLPAAGREAESALAGGALVLDYPGGDYEACRPWTQRNRVDFGGHAGFVRMALKTGAPVVPVVAHGSHHAVVVVARGERLAEVLGLSKLRVHVLPLLLGPPFGITPVFVPPMLAAITVEFLPALDWSTFGPKAAADKAVVANCYEEITATMQAALDRLSAEHRHPVVRGWANLILRGPRRIKVPAV
jgi:1-acyl-sn-glycerol-3-phosphate acyltransferase